MANSLILWPNYADTGVTYTPTLTAKASWPSTQNIALNNLKDRRLHRVARSQGLWLSDTRVRCDLGVDRSVRGVVLGGHSLSTSAKWRVLGVPSTQLFNYEAGDDITALGGTFTRAPTATVRAATYVDRDGVVQFAGENRLVRSEDFSTTWSASNVTVSGNSVAAPDTATTADTLTATSSNGTVTQSITTTAVSWTFSIWLKRKTGSGTVSITMDGSTYVAKTLTTEWQRFSVTQTGVAGSSTPGVKIATSADAVYAWGAQAEIGTSAKTYLPTTSAAVGAPRDAHFTSISGTRGLLREPARTNLCLQSENFGTTWSAFGTPTRSAAAHTASGVTLDLIGDDDGAGSEGYSQDITFTGDAVKAVSAFVKAGSATTTGIVLRDVSAGADRLVASIAWSGGVPTPTASTGTYIGMQTLAGGVYRVLFASSAVTAANTNRISVYPVGTTAANTGTTYVGGVQCENAAAPSSYIPTTTATVARAADFLQFAWAGGVPAASTFYVDYVDQGGAAVAVASVRTYLLWLGASGATTAPYLHLRQRTSDGFDIIAHDNSPDTEVDSVANTTNAPSTYGMHVELAGQLASTGAVQMHRATAGGSFTSHTASSAPASGLAAAWTGTTVTVGSDPTGADGNPCVIYSVRVTSGVQTGASMRTVVSDSGWLDAWPSGIDAEESEGMTMDAVYLLDTAFSARYWSAQISDGTNADGYVDVGRLFVGAGFQPTVNVAWGAELSVDTLTTRERSRSGVAYYDEQPRYRRWAVTFDDSLTESEAMVNVLDFLRIAGIHQQFYFVYDPDDTTHMHRRAFLATLERLSALRARSVGIWGAAYEIVEEL